MARSDNEGMAGAEGHGWNGTIQTDRRDIARQVRQAGSSEAWRGRLWRGEAWAVAAQRGMYRHGRHGRTGPELV